MYSLQAFVATLQIARSAEPQDKLLVNISVSASLNRCLAMSGCHLMM